MRVRRDTSSNTLILEVTRNNGAAWKTFLQEPFLAKPGYILSVGTDGGVSWTQSPLEGFSLEGFKKDDILKFDGQRIVRLPVGDLETFLGRDAQGVLKYLPYSAISGGTTVSGVIDIPVGQSIVNVTSLSLSNAPIGAVGSVIKPTAGQYNIFPTFVQSMFTPQGFQVELSGEPETSGYKMAYTLIMP
jgi:hypothetical protein